MPHTHKYDYSKVDQMLLGGMSNSEIIKATGVGRQAVYSRRIKNKISPTTQWKRFEHLLGTMTDTELATIIGKNKNTITAKRMRDGIPPFASSREAKLQSQFVKTLHNVREQVYTPVGYADVVDDDTIYELKFSLNISSLHTAIGQLFCYSRFIPNRKLCIVTTKIFDQRYTEVCKPLGISILIVSAS